MALNAFFCSDKENSFWKALKTETLCSNALENPSTPLNSEASSLAFEDSIVHLDAQKTGLICQKLQIDLLVVDHYGLDYEWQRQVRNYAKYLLVLDDMAETTQTCDILLNQNFLPNARHTYKSLVSFYSAPAWR